MAGPSLRRQAWPFLVARGRRLGYRTLLAPDFLVAERDYGVLDDSVVPSMTEDQAQVLRVVSGAGRPLTVVHAAHQVTAADIAEPGTEPEDRPPRDEYGRPLSLMYGFVCEGDSPIEPEQDDLNACRGMALHVYRRFLRDEEGFTVELGREFPLRPEPTRSTPPVHPPQPRHAPLPRAPEPPAPRRVSGPIVAALLVIIGILVFVLVQSCGSGHKDPSACSSVGVLLNNCGPTQRGP